MLFGKNADEYTGIDPDNEAHVRLVREASRLDRLKTIHEGNEQKLVKEGNHVLVVEDCLSKEQADRLRRAGSTDIEVVTRQQAIEAAKTGGPNTIILARAEDFEEEIRSTAQCRMLLMQNYHILHLAATIDLARSIIMDVPHPEKMATVGTFFSMVMQEQMSSSAVRRLLDTNVIDLVLPLSHEEEIEDIDGLIEEHLRFIESA
jgi:hypothetical protein